jgi:hypothetical protein
MYFFLVHSSVAKLKHDFKKLVKRNRSLLCIWSLEPKSDAPSLQYPGPSHPVPSLSLSFSLFLSVSLYGRVRVSAHFSNLGVNQRLIVNNGHLTWKQELNSSETSCDKV